MSYQLEVGARSIEDVFAAHRGGADRVELYVSPNEGALTPSAGLVKACVEARKKAAINIGLFAMLRPRAGDMLYSKTEFTTMRHDQELLLQQGIDGLMFGILTPEGELDLPRMRELIKHNEGKLVTLHRAFDAVRDPFETMRQAIDLGVEYVLCGGLAQSGTWDRKMLPDLFELAAGRIKMVIALGSAFKTENLPDFLNNTPFQEYHIVNGYRCRASGMKDRPDMEAAADDHLQKGMDAVEYLEEEAVREIRRIMDTHKRKK